MPNREEDKLPDLLQSLRKQGDGFSSPGQDYFEAMAKRSLEQARQPAVRRSLSSRWLAIAASALVLMLAGWWMLKPGDDAASAITAQGSPMSSDELLAEINIEEIDAYISEQIDEFTLELYEEAPLKD